MNAPVLIAAKTAISADTGMFRRSPLVLICTATIHSRIACDCCFNCRLGLQIAAVHELEAEPSLDAKVAVCDLDVKR
jgi:hypothetical protein